MTISNETEIYVDAQEDNTERQNCSPKEIVIWLSIINMLFLIILLFVYNFTVVSWEVDAFVLISMFIQTTIIVFSIPKKNELYSE